VDVLSDGTLALPDAILARLDVVLAAVHGSFDLSRRRPTDRLLRTLDQRYVSILAHPTTRLLEERPPLECDWAKVFLKASGRPCYLELNAQPARLDLDDVLVREAAASGILISIASDAHSVRDFAHLDGGILQARRGRLTENQVLNAKLVAEVRKLLARTFARSRNDATAARGAGI
jgi:DNA polymerase (family 10)